MYQTRRLFPLAFSVFLLWGKVLEHFVDSCFVRLAPPHCALESERRTESRRMMALDGDHAHTENVGGLMNDRGSRPRCPHLYSQGWT